MEVSTRLHRSQHVSQQSQAQFEGNRQTGSEDSLEFETPRTLKQKQLQAVANNSPQVHQLKALQAGINQSPQVQGIAQRQAAIASTVAPVQMKINHGKTLMPTTWKAALKTHGKTQVWNDILEIKKAVKQDIEKEEAFDEARFERVWNKVAKGSKGDFDIQSQAKVLVNELVSSYKRSAKCAKGYQKKSSGQLELIDTFFKDTSTKFEYKPSARNPMMQVAKMNEFKYDKKKSREQQTQRHIATLLFANYGGTEMQSSLSKDGTKLMISSNENGPNQFLQSNIHSRQDLLDLAMQYLKKNEALRMQEDEWGNDRNIRHAMKLRLRLSNYMDKNATVAVPKDQEKELDGRHAEIRIQQDKGWDSSNFHLPSGTKYPCMGCTLYFDTQGISISLEMGPMWLTDSALSTQLEKELKNQCGIGKMKNVGELASKIYKQYQNLSGGVKMGHGLHRDKKYSTDFDADSESDLDEDEVEEMWKLLEENSKLEDESSKKKVKVPEDLSDDEFDEENDEEYLSDEGSGKIKGEKIIED
jgi:hypothetical protein